MPLPHRNPLGQCPRPFQPDLCPPLKLRPENDSLQSYSSTHFDKSSSNEVMKLGSEICDFSYSQRPAFLDHFLVANPPSTAAVPSLELHSVSRPHRRTHFDLLALSAAECDFTSTRVSANTECINCYPMPQDRAWAKGEPAQSIRGGCRPERGRISHHHHPSSICPRPLLRTPLNQIIKLVISLFTR